MVDVIFFTPRPELDARKNLASFIAFARDKLTAFGADLPFDAIKWDVTLECDRKGQGDKRERITFCTLQSAGAENPEPMSDEFRPFAQAYIRQQQALKPVVALGARMAALRALEAALNENGAHQSPVKVDGNILNRAAQLLKKCFSKEAAYRNGIQLEMVAKYLDDHQLTAVPSHWRNPIKRPPSGTRVGSEFDERRARKLPSTAALEALPYVFRHATAPRDVVVGSTAAILCSAPDRINEALILPVECEVKNGDAFGLRWWPAKDANPMVKPIVASMSGVVKDALTKIRKVTEPARTVARWYEEKPGQIYLPPELEDLRSQALLSMAEIGEVLWGQQGAAPNARQWCDTHDISRTKRGRKDFASFADVEKAVLGLLPAMFPVLEESTGLKYSEALMVVPKHTFHNKKATYTCLIEAVTIQHINDGLGARLEHGASSVFDVFGLTEADGSPIRVTSHQFRHYLNTLAQAGGLSQLDIAKWSGRKDIRQNEAYDHVTADEMVATIRDAVGDASKAIGPLSILPKHPLIRRDEFARLMIPTAHTTDIGYCVHDYTMAPCQVHLDCINCQEHVCIKGDETKASRLRQQLLEAEGLLAKAEAAVKDGYWGSDRWLEHHRLTTERLRQLCQIMDDPKVPGGTVIQLNNVQSASRIEQAAVARAMLPAPPEKEDPISLESLRALLEGREKSS
ncbi:integrase [Burkholderia pseudomallei]|uniref:integrase n=1 Tax=Burkholderia pseudomallei TaxID=28450 RepID=UPI0006BD6E22|nr:integrase [Burkholderia pseudomallei]ALB92652.1 integrase [Burkholderia pseudomallei]ALB98714.1 integrase [Burkholderia pseudomallei]